MNAKISFFSFIVLLVAFSAPAQKGELASFTSGTLMRPGSSHVQPFTGYQFKFRFLDGNSDVNGLVNATTSMNLTEINSNCCFYGRKFNIADFAEGLNNFVQGTDPVTVNGTNYTSFWYRGTIRFNGSAMVPMYFKKKAGPTLKIPITMTGYIKGYATLADRNADTNALFNVPFTNLRGLATYTIRSHSTPTPGMENHFDIVSVSYEVAP